MGYAIPWSPQCKDLCQVVYSLHDHKQTNFTRSVMYRDGVLIVSASGSTGILDSAEKHKSKTRDLTKEAISTKLDDVSNTLDSIVKGEESDTWTFESKRKVRIKSLDETSKFTGSGQDSAKTGIDLSKIIPTQTLDNSSSSEENYYLGLNEVDRQREVTDEVSAETTHGRLDDKEMPLLAGNKPGVGNVSRSTVMSTTESDQKRTVVSVHHKNGHVSVMEDRLLPIKTAENAEKSRELETDKKKAVLGKDGIASGSLLKGSVDRQVIGDLSKKGAAETIEKRLEKVS